MIEIKLKVTPEQFEMANYILGQAIGEIERRKIANEMFDISERQVNEAEKLRMKMVKAFMEAHNDRS